MEYNIGDKDISASPDVRHLSTGELISKIEDMLLELYGIVEYQIKNVESKNYCILDLERIKRDFIPVKYDYAQEENDQMEMFDDEAKKDCIKKTLSSLLLLKGELERVKSKIFEIIKNE